MTHPHRRRRVKPSGPLISITLNPSARRRSPSYSPRWPSRWRVDSSKAQSVARVETRSGSALTDAVQVIIASKNRLDRTSSASRYASHPQRIITNGAETNTVPLTGPSVSGWTLQSDKILYTSQPPPRIPPNKKKKKKDAFKFFGVMKMGAYKSSMPCPMFAVRFRKVGICK